MSGVISPDDLRRIADDVEMAKAREALEKRRKAEHERNEFRDAFMHREVQPEAFERLSRLVKSAAERGEHEVLVMRFPSAWCTDGGRAINRAACRAMSAFSCAGSRRAGQGADLPCPYCTQCRMPA